MVIVDLKNKPLVEALLEIRWRIGQSPGPDPHYQLLLGRLYDKLQSEYPSHIPLPAAQLPVEVVAQAGIVQHQLRPAPDDWPLIQLGPGVMSVNVTDKYVWDDFSSRCANAVEQLFAVHPSASDLRVTSAMLRYIDAVEFDFNRENVFAFLRDRLKIAVEIATPLFDETGVAEQPSEIDASFVFPSSTPKGTVKLRFVSGTRDGKPALIWETIVLSRNDDVPSMPAGFDSWLAAAHTVTHDWFFKMIEGELHRRFSGD